MTKQERIKVSRDILDSLDPNKLREALEPISTMDDDTGERDQEEAESYDEHLTEDER